MTLLDGIVVAVGLLNAAGIGGLWFRLGSAIESNKHTHTRMDSLASRVGNLEQKAWRLTA